MEEEINPNRRCVSAQKRIIEIMYELFTAGFRCRHRCRRRRRFFAGEMPLRKWINSWGRGRRRAGGYCRRIDYRVTLMQYKYEKDHEAEENIYFSPQFIIHRVGIFQVRPWPVQRSKPRRSGRVGSRVAAAPAKKERSVGPRPS